MPRKIVELEYDSDENRPGASHKREGSNSPNFYDDEGNLVETATYREIDEDELRERFGGDHSQSKDEETDYDLTEEQEQFAEFLGVLIVEIVIAASPHVKNWWIETAFPGIKSLLHKIKDGVKSRFSKEQNANTVNVEVVDLSRSLPSAQQVAIELKEQETAYRIDMNSEEAQRTLIETVVLASLLARRLDILSHARIVDEDAYQLGETLKSDSVLEAINHILLTNPDIVDSQTIAGLETALNRNLFSASGELIPIREEEMNKLLPDGPEDDEDGCSASNA